MKSKEDGVEDVDNDDPLGLFGNRKDKRKEDDNTRKNGCSDLLNFAPIALSKHVSTPFPQRQEAINRKNAGGMEKEELNLEDNEMKNFIQEGVNSEKFTISQRPHR